MGTLGGQEMLLVLVLALLFFGPRELLKIARTIARAMTEFRQAHNELRTTFSREPEGHNVLVAFALALLFALLLFATKFPHR